MMPKIEYIPGRDDHHGAMSKLDALVGQIRSEANKGNRRFTAELEKGENGTALSINLGPAPKQEPNP